MPKLAIIILSFNTKEITLNCISSIISNPPKKSYEIVVVDNASTDGTQKYLKEIMEFHKIRYGNTSFDGFCEVPFDFKTHISNSKVKDVVIDGSIWLLSSSGKVTKLTNGNPMAILMKGIIDEINNPTAIYTNEELKYVYILEREKGRVVILEKNGNFKMQYTSDAIKEAKDLVVSEKENKVILLISSKLMYFEP